MSSASEASERRRSDREKRPLACELVLPDGRRPAVVLDMSESGLFVRTNAALPPGTEVKVVVRRPGGEAWEIEARVARLPKGGPDQPLFSGRGLGLSILEAPAAFWEFLRSLSR